MLKRLRVKVEPGFPFDTVSARSVWSATKAAFTKNPSLSVGAALRAGFQKSGVPSSELTREDMELLQMAAQWWAYENRPEKTTVTGRMLPLLRNPSASATQMLKDLEGGR